MPDGDSDIEGDEDTGTELVGAGVALGFGTTLVVREQLIKSSTKAMINTTSGNFQCFIAITSLL